MDLHTLITEVHRLISSNEVPELPIAEVDSGAIPEEYQDLVVRIALAKYMEVSHD